MAVSGSLFSDDLLQALYTKPYAGIVSYLSPSDHLTVMDFDRSALAKDHWLDEPQMYGGSKVGNGAILIPSSKCFLI